MLSLYQGCLDQRSTSLSVVIGHSNAVAQPFNTKLHVHDGSSHMERIELYSYTGCYF